MQNDTGLSFLDATFRRIYPQDLDWRQRAEARLAQLDSPPGALGVLIDLAVDLAGITRSLSPPVARAKVVVMVGDHGVRVEDLCPDSAEALAPMVANIIAGQVGINVLAQQAGAGVCLVDVGCQADFADLVGHPDFLARKIGRGTANMVYGPAMTRTHAVMAVEAGVEVANQLAAELDVFGLGGLGVGNIIASTAIAAVCTGTKVAELFGRDRSSDDAGPARRQAVVEQTLARNRPDAKDGLDILAKVGGFEIGAVAGLIIGAAALRKPVVIDGFAATAGAMIACKLEPFVRDYLISAHRGGEPGHAALLDLLRCRPLLDLHLGSGEGAGAALALPLVAAAAALLTSRAPSVEAGGSGPA